ncbi:MAG: CHAT domain-containing protein [Desulfobacteraceae bacterium]|nr:CHAT domain-containing protein [Desulfobacteraceae bacterium]
MSIFIERLSRARLIEANNIFLTYHSEINAHINGGGRGGNVTIRASESVISDNSGIYTTAFSEEDSAKQAGNIMIKADNETDPAFVIMNQSKIIAKASKGDGGNILIAADHYIQSWDSEVNASSEFGVDGRIEIISPDADITNSLTVLPSDFPDASRWIKTPCSERSGEKISRFVLTERDGLPASPDDWLASPPSVFDMSDTVMQTEKTDQLLAKGEEFYHKGGFENAARTWEQAIPLLDTKESLFVNTLEHLVYSYQKLGLYQKALSILLSQLSVEKSKDQYRNAVFFNSIGDIYLSLGNTDMAELYFEKAMKQARSADSSILMAKIQNNMGNFLAAVGNHQGAMNAYTKSLELIESPVNDAELKSVIFINIARLTLKVNDYMEQDIISPLEIALLQTETLPDSHIKASNSLSLALLSQKIRQTLEIKNSIKSARHFRKTVFDLLTLAKQLAENLEDTRTASYACGYLGQLYEEEMQYQEAMKLTRKAIFFAQQTHSPEILYLWQWQLGRLFKAKEDTENSIKAYNTSIDTLNPVRKEFFYGYRGKPPSFYENIKPVYLELAELLLKQAEDQISGTAKKHSDESLIPLRKARDTMELLKQAELQNFFQDECVISVKKKIARLDRTPSHTALIYPIPLHNHLVLLLTLPDGIKQIRVPVDSETIRERVQRFVNLLENVEDNRFRYYAKQFYSWLIGPVENELILREIDTLIIVPDGTLRLIPFSALHNGEHFLIEKYALATVPAITLTDLEPIKVKTARILLSGLSEASQGFPPLVNVTQELEEFKNHEYSVIHMATHGKFGSTPQDTFLLTYDGKLTFNRLEKLISFGRFRKNPIELLTLSACQTALGDERAALGLSGVALKAGVRSTIATLWRIDDKTASLVITEFYRQLKVTENISKAKALQNAQKSLIAQSDYNHPAYWAPFLLIGNWM